MSQTNGNYAFIDSQNLNISVQNMGWNLDWTKFRQHLHEKYHVEVAYLFIGFMPDNQELYAALQKAGYIIIFKPVHTTKDGVKGNVDTELVLQAMIEKDRYEKAVIVSGDADFYALVRYLDQQNKLAALIVPNKHQFNSVLSDAAKDKITHLNNMRKQLEYRRHSSKPKPAAEQK